MEDKYYPGRLLLKVAMRFEYEEEKSSQLPPVGNEEMAKCSIVIEIKDSTEKFRIIMVRDKNRVDLLRNTTIKNHDELEKSKDELEAVTIYSKDRKPKRYLSYEEFCRDIGI